jgi:hypothetical protein
MSAATHTFSCVTDELPHLQLQTHYWAISLLDGADVPPDRLLIHAVGRMDHELRGWLRDRGVRVVRIRPFGGPGYCNKLNALASLGEAPTSHVVAMDCDTVVTGAATWPAPDVLAAKMVDAPRPPPSVWKAILDETGLGEPEWARADLKEGPEGWDTEASNRNGGVYVMHHGTPRLIEAEWRRWLRWCMAPPPTVGRLHWIDQVALALARRSLGLRFDTLDRHYNFPLVERTDLVRRAAGTDPPVVLHHHHRLDNDLFLAPTGVTVIDKGVTRVNETLAEHRVEPLVRRLGTSSVNRPSLPRRARRVVSRRLPRWMP